ncbi:MAG: cupredoxin domain-containing protein, partial [Chitinophagaceae bacterium]|nr:cupredoxin domain-containing protein [Rubrivivax sp.]
MAAGAAAVTMPLLATRAQAHTDKPHAPKAGPAVKEQKDWGIAGDAARAKRSIAVGMADNMRFTPARIEVRQGETVKFVVRNDGKQMHEFVIGTKAENAKHAEMMVKFPNMEHDEP